MIRHAVVAFSNFPLGLAILPGDTAPLSCRLPISHLPITPLTHVLGDELSDVRRLNLAGGFRLVVAECLDDSDEIKPHSLHVWSLIKEVVSSIPGGSCEIVEVRSKDALKATLHSLPCDILILSAHGNHDRRSGLATIKIGNERVLGEEIDNVPPLVLLSACHVSPRGMAGIGIAEVFLRKGAIAVLGTLVPINVMRNGVLLVRLFVYIAEALAGREPYRSLRDIWHFVATYNAFDEVLSSSKFLQNWRVTEKRGRSVVEEFMMVRSRCRIRSNHVYEDTVQILEEIADDRGVGDRFRLDMKNHGYFPESLLYVLWGHPEHVVW